MPSYKKRNYKKRNYKRRNYRKRAYKKKYNNINRYRPIGFVD